MTKNRIEGFSDAVFAIVITLLIIEVKVPEVDKNQLNNALLELTPKMIAYVLSFVVIGLYWIIHHTMLQFIEKVNRNMLLLNLLILLVVVFIPFPTALLGSYPLERTPVVLYGVTLFTANMLSLFFWIYITSRKEFVKEYLSKKYSRLVVVTHLIAMFLYLVAIAISNVDVLFSYVIYITVPLFFILANPIINKVVSKY